MNLISLLEEYRLERGIRQCTADRMRRSISVFGEYLEHAADTTDFNRTTVNGWLNWLGEKYSRKTVREFRGDLLAVWNYAAIANLVPDPSRIRVVRLDSPIPDAWTIDEVRALIAASYRVRHGGYVRLLLTIVYETGMRRFDVLKLKATDVRADGIISFVQHKTTGGHAAKLTFETHELLKARGHMRPPVGIRRIYRILDHVCELAKVRKGAMQKMRRTGATQVERTMPGCAQKYLGHKTAGLAWKYYIDRTQLTDPVTPPSFH